MYAIRSYYALGICNGCQLMIELGLVNSNHSEKPKMDHNISHKFESTFLTIEIGSTPSIMLKTLEGSRLGVWVAHGEGRFVMPYEPSKYNIVAKYIYSEYPGNPNASAYDTAGLVSDCGRHLAMMPHPERAIFPWQCATYPLNKKSDECTPWLEAFVNARKWVQTKK